MKKYFAYFVCFAYLLKSACGYAIERITIEELAGEVTTAEEPSIAHVKEMVQFTKFGKKGKHKKYTFMRPLLSQSILEITERAGEKTDPVEVLKILQTLQDIRNLTLKKSLIVLATKFGVLQKNIGNKELGTNLSKDINADLDNIINQFKNPRFERIKGATQRLTTAFGSIKKVFNDKVKGVK